MRAVLIDTDNKAVTEVAYDGDFHSIYRFIDADCFDVVVHDTDKGEVDFFVDDEALLKSKTHGWTIKGQRMRPIMGKALALGLDPANGDSVDCPLGVEEIAAMVQFVDLDKPLEPWGVVVSWTE